MQKKSGTGIEVAGCVALGGWVFYQDELKVQVESLATALGQDVNDTALEARVVSMHRRFGGLVMCEGTRCDHERALRRKRGG